MAGLGSLLGLAAPASGTSHVDAGKPLPGLSSAPGGPHCGTPLWGTGCQGRGGRGKGLALSARAGAGGGAGPWEGIEEGSLLQSGWNGGSWGVGALAGGLMAGSAWAAAGGGGMVGGPGARLKAEASAEGSGNGRLPTSANASANGHAQVLSVTEPQAADVFGMLGEEDVGAISGDYSEDEELRSVVQDIATLEIQTSSVAEQVTAHARTLAEASKKLRARAQATRLEAAKLKKVARLFQAQEFRQREELRASRLKGQEDARRQQQEQQEAQEQLRALQHQLLMQQLQLDQQQQLIEEQQQQLQQQMEEEQLRIEREQEQAAAAAAAAAAAPAPEAEAAALDSSLSVGPQTPQQQEEVNASFLDQPGDASRRSSSESDGTPGGTPPPGPPPGGHLGAAVLPFAFPDGKHFGKGVDSAVASGPAVEGGRESLPHPLSSYTSPPPPPVAEAQAPAAGVGAGAGAEVGAGMVGQSQNGSGVAGAGAAGESLGDAISVHQSSDGSLAVSETMECEIAHPGAMACTKTVVKKDSANKLALVSMETTVRCTEDGCLVGSLNVDDFAALAMASLSDMALELKHSPKFQGVDSDPRVASRRTDIVELLAEGEVVECRAMEPPSKFGHESFIVQLRNKKTGQQIKGMFKPRVEGDAEGWHRAPVEWVAYELNLLLGMDYIPPVAYRTGGVDLGNNKKYEEGAFLYWVPAAKELRQVHASSWGVSVARLLSDTRILDILLNNSDRHHGHFLFGEHWADGRKRVVLIDHAAGFRKEASVLMEHENAFQTGPVRCVSAHTYMRLRFLDREMVESKFRGVLSQQEMDGLLERKDKVLEYLDQLVQDRGYNKTVVE